MIGGWFFLMPFPGCVLVLVLLPGLVALGRLREHLWPPAEDTSWPPPPHGRSGAYVPRGGPRPFVSPVRVVSGPVLLRP